MLVNKQLLLPETFLKTFVKYNKLKLTHSPSNILNSKNRSRTWILLHKPRKER